MRKNIIFSLMVTLCVVVLSFACVKTENPYKTIPQKQNNEVLNVANNAATNNKVLETRFLNMLNHSFVYNDAFYSDKELVENAVLALLDKAEESYLEEFYLSDYLLNMYGKNYQSFEFLDEVLTEKEGYVYIAPSGYSVYNHKIVSLTDNSDGSYTVISDVEISNMDGSVESLVCETVFLEAEDSAFGYNIMYSEIAEGLNGEADC